jgi:hypothetical protein
MIAAMVVPFGSQSIFRTVDCLEEDGAVAFGDDTFGPLSFVEAAGFDRAGARLLADRFAGRDDLRDVFADFDFDLPLAIRLSSGSRQHHVLPLTRPADQGGAEK